MKEQSLEKLVPVEIVPDLIGRTDLSNFDQKLACASKQAEYACGVEKV